MRLGPRGGDAAPRGTGVEVDRILHLPDDEKLDMCMGLLDEFGAANMSVKGDEIIHSCCLPFGLHTNGDRNPSASLNWRKLVYHCYGCSSGGGLLWWVATCKGEDTTGLNSWISKRLTEDDPSKALENFATYIDRIYSPENHAAPPPMPRFNPDVLAPWRLIHPYLTEIRHIPEQNIIDHQVGWDSKTNRIVMPHFWKGNLVGWQTRRLTDDGTPKYKNTPDFPKDRTLYHEPQDKERAILVVESVMSVVSKSHMASNICATFGASVTDRQKLLIADRGLVHLWFDNDAAGWKATQEVGEFLSRYSDVFVVNNPWAADPADLDDDTFATVRQSVVPFAMWSPPELREWKQ